MSSPMVMLPSWSMMIGVPSFHPGQLSSTQIRVAHSQISYPPDRMPDRLMYPTLTMSLSLERTLPSCWLVVPCRMVLLMCSRISAVLRGRSPRNFLIFSRMRTVFMFLSSFDFASRSGAMSLYQRSEATHITVPPTNDEFVTVTDHNRCTFYTMSTYV